MPAPVAIPTPVLAVGVDAKQPTKSVKIVHITDTHDKHTRIQLPPGDILVHTGDFTHKRDWKDANFPASLVQFNTWLGTLPYKYKIVIAGNHELGMHYHSKDNIQKALSNAIYLQDSGVEVMGIKFFGVPWTPSRNMGFSLQSSQLATKWSAVPEDTDVLLTHLPPYKIFDLAWEGEGATVGNCKHCGAVHDAFRHWGSDSLLQRTRALKNLRVHMFGHVHDDTGYRVDNGILYINACTDLHNKAYSFDFFPKTNPDPKQAPRLFGSAAAPVKAATDSKDSKSSAPAPTPASAGSPASGHGHSHAHGGGHGHSHGGAHGHSHGNGSDHSHGGDQNCSVI